MIRCSFCGYEFSEEEGVRGCRNCPMGSGCKMLKCPRCNYEMPPEPAWITKLKKLFRKNDFSPATGVGNNNKEEKEKETMVKMLKMLAGLVLLVLLTVFVVGAAVAAAKNEATYEKDVKKIIAERCLSCHGDGAPTMEAFKKDEEGFKKAMKGPRMDTYANLMVLVNGSDTGALMRRLDDGKTKKDGKPGNMYQNLGGTEEARAANLSVFKNWVGGWTLKRKAAITAEERKAIKALEK